MHAWRLHHLDGRLQPRLEPATRPELGAGQLLVRVRAAGLNRGEFIPGHGLHGPVGQPGPSAPQGQAWLKAQPDLPGQAAHDAARPAGSEAAGEVVALGAGVTGWRPGDRVMGRCPGAFADYALMHAGEALPVPAALGWHEAGAVPLTFLVVYDMLVLQGRLQPGETLLVAGVTSGVGVAALLAAKALGARVIGTSGSAEKLARLQTLGLDLGLHTRAPDFVDSVREATGGRGADLAINTVGGTLFAACVQALGFEGRLAMVGYVDGVLRTELDLEALHTRRLRLFGVSNKLRTPTQRAATVAAFRADWLPRFADGGLRPLVDRVHPFEALEAAMAAMEGGRHVGKIVLAGSPDD